MSYTLARSGVGVVGLCDDLGSLGAETISIESVISRALTKDIGRRRASPDEVGVVGVAIVAAFRLICGD